VKFLSSWWTGAPFHKQPAIGGQSAAAESDRLTGGGNAAAIAEAEPPVDARRRSMTAGQWQLAEAGERIDSDEEDWEVVEDE
jgi:hypothetical protein